MTTNLLSSSSMMGTNVVNRTGDNLGDIKDIMIDPSSGNVAYVVVSFGGFLGIGDKYFAIPMEAFHIDRENENFILDVDKAKMENAPGFDKDNWPSSADRQFLTDVHSHYGYKPYWERERQHVFSGEQRASTGAGASGMGATGHITRESTADRLGGTGSDRLGGIGGNDPNERLRDRRSDDRDLI